MFVHIHNQDQACALSPIKNTVVISICNPGHTAPLLEGWDAVLRIKFHGADHVGKADPPRGSYPGALPPRLTHFDEHLAREIDGFVHANHNKNFVVHCKAGLHRSLAVGAYIQNVFGAEMVLHTQDALADVSLYENDRVYQLLMRPYEA